MSESSRTCAADDPAAVVVVLDPAALLAVVVDLVVADHFVLREQVGAP